MPPLLFAPLGDGRDDVIRLKAVHMEHGNFQQGKDFLYPVGLRVQVLRGFLPGRLVFLVHLVAESRRARVKGGNEAGGLVLLYQRDEVPEKNHDCAYVLVLDVGQGVAHHGKVSPVYQSVRVQYVDGVLLFNIFHRARIAQNG